MVAYPGWLSRAGEDDNPPRSWKVSPGVPYTDIARSTMSVPTGDSTLERVMRVKELVKAKFSPESCEYPFSFDEDEVVPSTSLIEACETARINVIASGILDDVRVSRFGDELTRARLLARSKNFDALKELLVSLAGTTSIDSVVKTLSEEMTDPAEVGYIRKIKSVVKGHIRTRNRVLSSQDIWCHTDDNKPVPEGFVWSVRLAEALTRVRNPRGGPGRGKEPGKVGPPGGLSGDDEQLLQESEFAELIEKRLPKPERVAGRLGRKRIATDVGANPRRISRMLTDPDRRIFDRRTRALGGVVLIDQSGSMNLRTEQIWQILQAAPGCTVIGYSHRPHSHDIPNIWVLAHEGKVISEVPDGNVGNGVDGPALLFALRYRKNHKQPFIWVCDGQVTSYNDSYTHIGAQFCANVVRRHQIHMVDTVSEAVTALQVVANGKVLPTKLTGPLSR